LPPGPEMSDTRLIVPYITESPGCYDLAVTVNRDSSHLPNLAEFAVAAEQAASTRSASIMSAHSAEKIISIVTVQAVDRPWRSPLPWLSSPMR